MSPYLHISSFSLKLCTFCAVTTSSLNAFHFSTVLCGKLYFSISYTLPLPNLCMILLSFQLLSPAAGLLCLSFQ
ncbi:hypothetical protein E2C01_024294 [Portunus trituberculatus]|uniref:Uncharacterized protein n=1 Tax=Portunus trituberculatus TaxID=210409 RepID=A0A5B7E9Y3_PORTR|nr:hypothetical protein [Portunus trituberculatus]